MAEVTYKEEVIQVPDGIQMNLNIRQAFALKCLIGSCGDLIEDNEVLIELAEIAKDMETVMPFYPYICMYQNPFEPTEGGGFFPDEERLDELLLVK
jgi:hypothetical protein